MLLRIIPVIDLKGGRVVHARMGQRDSYQPIASPLCGDSDLFQVLQAFLKLYPFDTVYIADLDALTGQGGHAILLEAALRAYPQVSFWIDCGLITGSDVSTKPVNYWPVLGSEYLREFCLPELLDFKGRYILSLDFFGDQPSGPQTLFENAAYWPERVIVMTLGRVGSAQGPDYRRLSSYVSNYPKTKFIAAGGVRDRVDLMHLQELGVESALLASALHAQAIDAEDIRYFHAGKKIPR